MAAKAKVSCSSMTGFGASEGTINAQGDHIRWELRSVNGKGLDVRLKVPSQFIGLEATLKRSIQDGFKRGNIQVSGTFVENGQSATQLEFNDEGIEAYLIDRQQLELKFGPFAPVDFEQLALDSRFQKPREQSAETDEETERVLLQSLAKAIAALQSARLSEGEKLQTILMTVIGQIRTTLNAIIASAANSTEQQHERLKKQLDALLGDHKIDPQRLAQEIALLATKADIREETDRLQAHCEEAETLLVSGKPVGRRLDFLAQEFSREANTLCAKAATNEITRLGLDLKTMIDQFREQTQNVE